MSALSVSHAMSVNAAEVNVKFSYIDIVNHSEREISEWLVYDVPKELPSVFYSLVIFAESDYDVDSQPE